MTATKRGRQGRPPADGGPRVPIHGPSLRWARERAGLSQDQLAARVSARLARRAAQRRGTKRGLPESISAVAVSYWESGRTPSCGVSVLTNLAFVLKVTPDGLRTDRPGQYVPVAVQLPGMPPIQLEVNPRGRVRRPAEFAIRPAAAGMLVDAWTSLEWWRARLLDDATPPEADSRSASESVPFMDAMLRALSILLAPLERGARLREIGVLDLVGLGNPVLREVAERARKAKSP